MDSEISTIYEALDNMDDYALMSGVKPIGPHKVLTDAIAELETLRQRVQELEKETKQLRDLQYELMRSGALVAIEKCKNATGQRRVIDMYVSANQIAEDLLNAMDSGA